MTKSIRSNNPFFLESLSPSCTTALATSIAQALAEGLTTTQMYALSAFISSISSMIGLIATQTDLVKDICGEKDVDTE